MCDGDDRVVGPLRELREPLHAGLHQVQVAAGAVSESEPRMAIAAVETAWRYLQEVFVPACIDEHASLFVAVETILNTREALTALRMQHESLTSMVLDLEKVVKAVRDAGSVEEYRRYLLPLLHGLYAAIRVHIESEDDALLSLLDVHLTSEQVEAVCAGLASAAQRRAIAATDP